MNRLLLLSVIMLSFFSCNQQKKESGKKNKAENDLIEAISKAEESEIIETKTFLGFEFGMTDQEVNNYLLKLKKEGKIYINSRNSFQYDFYLSGMEIYLNFVPEYYEGKLYKITYPANTKLGVKDVHIFLLSAFRDTKDDFKTHINEDILGDTYYTNIKDNMIITFRDSKMIYENAPISKLAKQKEEEIRKEKSNKSNSEF